MSIAVKRTQRERLSVAACRSILGGVITLFIDSYDIYLPALVLPAAETKNADLLEGADAQPEARQTVRRPAAVDRTRVPTTVT